MKILPLAMIIPVLAITASLFTASQAEAITLKCKGFAFGYASLTCTEKKAAVRSDFCDLLRPDIKKLRSLTKEELAALQRPRKEAIRNLRKTFKELNCRE